MTCLHKILEEIYTDGLEAELPLEEYNFNQKIQQILALIPKERPMTGEDLKCYCDGADYCNCQFSENDGFNQALDEMEQSMTGERCQD